MTKLNSLIQVICAGAFVLSAGIARAADGVGPYTALHYTSGSGTNFSKSGNTPGAVGFNVADVSGADEIASLPADVKALVWIGTCKGADAKFQAAIKPFISKASKILAFYLMDEPDPTGKWAPLCSAANLKAESDYIHATIPGSKTFIVMMNMGENAKPDFMNTYNYANTHIDYFGLDPYPCMKEFGGCNYNTIVSTVAAARKQGITDAQIIPVYQAMGGGGYDAWLVPSADDARQMLSTWKTALKTAAFDYVYAWGQQEGDTALESLPRVQEVFKVHNAQTSSNGGSAPAPVPAPMPSATPVATPAPQPAPNSALDMQAPSIAIKAASAQVNRRSSALVNIVSNDNIGVSKIVVRVDGKTKCTLTKAPFNPANCSFVANKRAGRTYSIEAKAYDAAGNIGSSNQIQIRVMKKK